MNERKEPRDILAELGASFTNEATPSHARYLWYGDLGEGKTHTIGILHNLLKQRGTRGVFMFDFENAAANTLKSAGFDVPYKVYSGKDSYFDFEKDITRFTAANHGFGALAFDSATVIERMVMKVVHRINPIDRYLKGKLKTLPTGISSIQDYGIAFEIAFRIFDFFIDVSRHMSIVMTAHKLERQNPITKVLEYLPAYSGKRMPSQFGRWFNEVWHIYSEMDAQDKIVRYAQTASFNKTKCKTQVKGMPHALPIEEALQRAIEAYFTGNIEEVVKDVELDAQPYTDASEQAGQAEYADPGQELKKLAETESEFN